MGKVRCLSAGRGERGAECDGGRYVGALKKKEKKTYNKVLTSYPHTASLGSGVSGTKGE